MRPANHPPHRLQFVRLPDSPMTETSGASKRKPSTIHRWIRRGFFAWAIVSTAWLTNSVRTQGVNPALLKNSPTVSLVHAVAVLEFLPTTSQVDTALIFFCGSGIAAEAYAPLLHPYRGGRISVMRGTITMAICPDEVSGGNHSQFGHYGHQLFDGMPTISRSDQQQIARSAILDVLRNVAGGIAIDGSIVDQKGL